MVDLKNIKIGQKVSGFLQIRNVSLRETKNGDPFIFMKAGNITGDILIKIWQVNQELSDLLVNNSVGNFVKLNELIVGSYNNNLELSSNGGYDIKYLLRDEIEKMKDFNIEDYTIGSPYKKDKMISEIISIINNDIDNDDIKKITKALLEKYYNNFVNYPAAIVMHHNYENGLLYHTYNMLNVGKDLLQHYKFVNKDLVLSGIILHDLGKVIEYKLDDDTGGYSVSKEGHLLGHIAILTSDIAKEGEKLYISDEVIINLQHIVLAHHGKLEWGSPILPKTPEAMMVHFIDNLDSKMEQMRKEIITLDEGEFSEKIYSLGNINMYKTNISGPDQNKKNYKEQTLFD